MERPCVSVNLSGPPASGSLVQRQLLGASVFPPAFYRCMVHVPDENLGVPAPHCALSPVLKMQR